MCASSGSFSEGPHCTSSNVPTYDSEEAIMLAMALCIGLLRQIKGEEWIDGENIPNACCCLRPQHMMANIISPNLPQASQRSVQTLSYKGKKKVARGTWRGAIMLGLSPREELPSKTDARSPARLSGPDQRIAYIGLGSFQFATAGYSPSRSLNWSPMLPASLKPASCSVFRRSGL